jgi:hypothetical protein
MQFREHQHNTPEQVEEYLAAALAAVEKLNPPEDLREAFFTSAVHLISNKQIIAEQAPPLMAIPRGMGH